jgi:hypothetical protein
MTGGLLKTTGKKPAPGTAPRRLRPANGWLLVVLALPALISAVLSEASQTPPPKDNFELGVLPQDRAWLCAADGAAACSSGDFLRAYGLQAPEYRDFGELVQERIGAGPWDPGRAVILNEKRKCADGQAVQCRGQVSGL